MLITDLGAAGEEEAEVRRVEGRLFADAMVREAVVKAASFGYGVRRALTPENRNRIRFLMKQEVKRSRRQRRADLRAARRYLADQQRQRAVAEEAA